ncbi:MAG: sugar ABC transporter substrate-binding protein [Butyricicoccus sp.]
MKKRMFALAMSGLMLLSCAACSDPSGSASDSGSKDTSSSASAASSSSAAAASDGKLTPKHGDKFQVAYLNRRNDNEFLVWLMDETVQRLEDDGRFEIATYDGMNDNQKQIQQIEDCITMDVDFVLIAVNDGTAQNDGLQLLEDAGIPIIGISTEPTEPPASFVMVGVNNVDLGYAEGQAVAENMPENAKILYMAGRSGTTISSDRKDGFFQALEDSGRTDYEILEDSIEVDYTAAQGMKIMEDWIIAYDDFDVVATVNDQSAYGAVQALQAADRLDGVQVYGIDAETVMMECIKNGEAVASIKQDVPGHGQKAYEVVCDLIDGKAVESRYDIPAVTVTIDNVDEYL